MLPWLLTTVKNGPRKFTLKFSPNWVRDSWDIADVKYLVVCGGGVFGGGGGGGWCSGVFMITIQLCLELNNFVVNMNVTRLISIVWKSIESFYLYIII